jgi:resuscitation-promoting factor RpfA
VASLTAHLLESGDHGRLGFHSSCPVCRRERLFGSLASDAIISRRAQAALASGVLALSAVGPAAALAQEPDQQLEGGSGPGGGTGEPDPGETGPGTPDSGAEQAPPSQPEPPPAPEVGSPVPPTGDDGSSDLDQVVPMETEPVENPGHGHDPSSQPELDDQPTAEVVEPQPPAPPTPSQPAPPAPETPMEAPVTVQPPAAQLPSEPLNSSHATLPAEQTLERTTVANHANYTVPVVARSAAPAATTADESGPTTAVTTTAAEPEPPPGEPSDRAAAEQSSHERFLIVRPGDSLWSIAKRLLGPGASSAQIARKVAHLWDLNSERIGTGRPDLLMVGTKLRLR